MLLVVTLLKLIVIYFAYLSPELRWKSWVVVMEEHFLCCSIPQSHV